MKVFEFHFNPKKNKETTFDSFIYEPENSYEEKLGNLYIIGELKNTLPQNQQLLNELASSLKKSYYSILADPSFENSLKKSLEETNKFLENQEGKGNISWLENLNIAVFNLKDLTINFTKMGEIKILLLRARKIIDLSKELEVKIEGIQEEKAFSNIVSGKLSSSDKIIILTKEIFNILSEKNLLLESLLIFEKDLKSKRKEQEFRKILNSEKKLLNELTGIFFLAELEGSQEKIKKIKKPVTSKENLFSKIPFRSPSLILFKINKLFEKIRTFLSKFSLSSKIKLHFSQNIKTQKTSKKLRNLFPRKLPTLKLPSFKQTLILIFVFFSVLVLGNYVFKIQEQKEIKRIQTVLSDIQEKTSKAEEALLYQDREKSNRLYQEAWEEITLLSKEEEIPLKEKIDQARNSIKESLFSLNYIEEITNPEIALRIEIKDFLPQKMLLFEKTEENNSFYLFSNQTNKIYKIEKDKKEELVETPGILKLAGKFKEQILVFSGSNQLTLFENDKQIYNGNIIVPYPNPNFVDFSTFDSNVYFLDNKENEIVKTDISQKTDKLNGGLWLNPETKKPSSAKSIAIDGSVWVLNKNNTILKYYRGEFQKEITIKTFPSIETISKISAYQNLPYLYVLTPNENRIIIVDKEGKVIKQYQGDNFNNLQDFTISGDGKDIYLLNNSEIYKISLDF